MQTQINQYYLHRSIDLLAGFTGDAADVIATQVNTNKLPVLKLPEISATSTLHVVLALYKDGITGTTLTTPAFTYTVQPIHVIDTCSVDGVYPPVYGATTSITGKNQWDVVQVPSIAGDMILRLTTISIVAQAAGIKLGVFVKYMP